jgi:hypothetical protein
VDHRHQYEVGEERSGADDGRVADADDVADTDDGSVVEDAQGHELAFENLTETDRAEAELLGPGVEGGSEAVVRSTKRGRHGEDLGLAADSFAGKQDLGGCRSLRPR